ncbi:MAG TPA: glycosyltransferase family 4 protein [Longimicrobiales bacterium]
MKVLAWPGCEAPETNPYSRLLYRHLQRVGGHVRVGEFSTRQFFADDWDLWHVHWPEALLHAPSAARAAIETLHFVAMVTVARLRGIRIVWTIHDLESHSRRRPRLEAWFKRWFIPRLDGAIALTPGGAAAARARYPALRDKPVAVIPHGHYMDVYPNEVSRSRARERLGIGAQERVLLFFGSVRPYKNVLHLIRVFRQLDADQLRLVVAGCPESAALGDEVGAACAADGRIIPVLRRIGEEEVQYFFNAADLVVLPFQEILNSGSALLALSFQRPVLVPARGAMPELRERVGESAVIMYDGDLTAATLKAALAGIEIAPPDPAGLTARLRELLDWDGIAVDTLRFYDTVLGNRGAVAAADRARGRMSSR